MTPGYEPLIAYTLAVAISVAFWTLLWAAPWVAIYHAAVRIGGLST